MSRLSRPGVLGGAAALVRAVGVGATPSPVHPDAALIAASARFVGVCRTFGGVCTAEPEWDRPGREAWEAQEAIASDAASAAASEVLALPCTSLAGVMALADTVVAHTPEALIPSSFTDKDLVRRLVEGVLAL